MKKCLSIIIISCLISCSTAEPSSEVKNKVTADPMLAIDFPNSICYPLDYAVFNISNDEDIKLLINEHPNFLKSHFNTSLENLFTDNRIKVVDQNCIQSLLIKELTFKEFKIQVNGPEVNVATVRVDYIFKSENIDTVLFETIEKESIPEFHEEVFEEMCNELSLKLIKRITPFIEK